VVLSFTVPFNGAASTSTERKREEEQQQFNGDAQGRRNFQMLSLESTSPIMAFLSIIFS
jgi:hypothetical protein